MYAYIWIYIIPTCVTHWYSIYILYIWYSYSSFWKESKPKYIISKSVSEESNIHKNDRSTHFKKWLCIKTKSQVYFSREYKYTGIILYCRKMSSYSTVIRMIRISPMIYPSFIYSYSNNIFTKKFERLTLIWFRSVLSINY